MSLESFAYQLENLIEEALLKGLPLTEVSGALAVAGMVLDERRPAAGYQEDEVA